MLLSSRFSSLKQVENNTQSDYTNESVLAQSIKQAHQIGDDPAEKGNYIAKQDLNNNPESNQQQRDFSNLTNPFLYFFEILHFLTPVS